MIRVGIIGCGRILAAHLRGYRLLREAGFDGFRITALCARKREDALMYVRRGEGPAQRPACSQIPGDPLAIGDEYLSDFQPDEPVEIYDDYRELIRSSRVDAINDFTSHAMHAPIAEIALAAKKPLLTQKAMAANLEQAEKMCELARRAGVPFGIFENFRFEHATRQLRWLAESGRIGKVQLALIGYIGAWWAPDRIVADTPWRHVKSEGGGITIDLACHFIDQLRVILGEPISVTGRAACLELTRRRYDEHGRVVQEVAADADDTFFADFAFENGALAQLSASWCGAGGATTFGPGTMYVGNLGKSDGNTVWMANGETASLDDLYQRHASAATKKDDFPLGIVDGFALGQYDWLQAILGRRHVMTGNEGLRDFSLAWSILESDRLGKRIVLPHKK